MTTTAMYVTVWMTICAMTAGAAPNRILMLVAGRPSHMIYFSELGRHLATRGHNVTLVHPARLAIPSGLAADAEIHFRSFRGETRQRMSDLEAGLFRAAFDYSVTANLRAVMAVCDVMDAETEALYENEALMRDLDASEFDFAVIDVPPSHVVLPYRLGAPFALLSPLCPAWNMGVLDLPSHVPVILTAHDDRMSLWQRLVNTVTFPLAATFWSGGQRVVARHAPSRPLVGYSDIMANISLCLKLRNPLVDYAKADPPNVIPIGGMMARNGAPLPPDYQQFMDGATEGVVYVSFGSQPLPFPAEVIDKLTNVFSRLEQRVIWRDPHVEKSRVSSNVMLVDWAPQVSILAHPSCRVFVTHGGVNSLIEAAHHGVPLVALPLGLDQNYNAAMIVRKGYGVQLRMRDFTPQELSSAITSVLQDEFKVKMAAVAEAFRSLPPGGDSAVYWIEHVIKHGGGHLRPGSVSLPWYQLLMVDIACVLLSVVVTAVWCLCACAGSCVRCTRRERKEKEA